MPPSEAPASSKPRKLVIAVWASIALAVVVIGSSYFLLPKGLFSVVKYAPYQGSIVVYADSTWEAPSGESVEGLLSYDPATKNVSYVIPPFSEYATLVEAGAVYQDRLLTIRQATTTTSLVTLDLKTQEAETVDSLPNDEGTFGKRVWSSDGTAVAYTVLPRSGRPTLRTSDSSGDLEFGTLLAFTSATDELLLDTRPSLTAVDVASGERREFTGAAFSFEDEIIHAAPSGNFVITHRAEDSVARVYLLVWNGHSISVAGFIPMEEGSDILFNANDQVLITPKEGPTRAYQLSADGNHQLIGVYNFMLPEQVRIVSWTSL